MKVLKLKLYQDLVCYKKPMSFRVGETYPLPPPSTLNGFFHKVLEANDYLPLVYSIQGTFGNMTHNLQKLYKFGGKRKGREDSYVDLIGSTAIKSMVYYTNLLIDVNLIIHVLSSEEILKNLELALLFSKEYPSLGRKEDLVRIDEVLFVDLEETIDQWNGLSLKNPAYIPKQYAKQNDLEGINFRLNDYYEVVDGFKKWNIIDMLYVTTGKIFTKVYIDNQGDLIFWHKEL